MAAEYHAESVELSAVVDPEAFRLEALRVYLDPLGERLQEPCDK
jgi:hypothetical protein